MKILGKEYPENLLRDIADAAVSVDLHDGDFTHTTKEIDDFLYGERPNWFEAGKLQSGEVGGYQYIAIENYRPAAKKAARCILVINLGPVRVFVYYIKTAYKGLV